jgi:predicted permease
MHRLRAGSAVDTFARDVRHAVRLLWRNPLFAVTAALSLAIGIGAVTAVFTLAGALLRFSPTAVANPDRLVDIGRSFDGIPFGFNPASYPDYLDIRRQTTTLEHVFAHPLFPKTMSLAAADGAEEVVGEVVTSNYFAALGTRPAIGRLFGPGDSDQLGASPLAVLSHRYWTRRFSADPGVVGSTVRLGRFPVTVVGVAPEGFQGTTVVAVDLWVPMSMVTSVTGATPDQLTGRGGWVVMGARMKEGVSLAQAEAELNAIDRALRAESPTPRGWRGLRLQRASPVAGNVPGAVALLVALSAFTGIVLTIACANIAGLLLARAADRRREMALRLAIGAGRFRLVRQLLTETLLLFALGAGAGIALARVMMIAILSVLPTLPIPIQLTVEVDWRALAFALGLSLIAAVLSGLAPALHASRTDVATVLKDEAQGPRLRLRSVFVVAQVALSLVLVVIGGLFTRALQEARSGDVGFSTDGVEVASLDVAEAADAPASALGITRDLLDRVRQLPGVEAASIARSLPLAGESLGFGVSLPGATPPPGLTSADVPVSGNIVEPGYFAALRIPLRRGRDFTDRDVEGAPLVAIVNEAAARRFWGGEDPIGRNLVVTGVGRARSEMQIVGMARDSQQTTFGGADEPFIYVPLRQNFVTGLSLLVRTSNGQRVGNRVRAVASMLNAAMAPLTVRSMDDVISAGLLAQRAGAVVAGGLGIIGLLLAAVGIYGVTAYSVARRTREMAIRSALGAPRGRIVSLVVKHGLTLAAVGSLIGLVLAVLAGQVLSLLLVGVSPIDPAALLTAMALSAIVVLVACYVPVRRAMRIPAAEALRAE